MFSRWSTRYGEWAVHKASNKALLARRGSLLAKRVMKLITREARINTREGERWITARAECSFSQNLT